MGHKTVAGLVSKTEMLGKALLRIDVPATERFPAFTQLYGEAAIYCVTFAAEEVVRRVADAVRVNPISVYAPTLFAPSLLVNGSTEQRCHLFVRDGKIEYLSDCWHALRGQTVEMEEEADEQ